MLASHGIRAVIPLPAEQARHRPQQRRLRGTPTRIDAEPHKDRHAVECGISILKHHRGFTTRYDKTRRPPPRHVAKSNPPCDDFRNTP